MTVVHSRLPRWQVATASVGFLLSFAGVAAGVNTALERQALRDSAIPVDRVAASYEFSLTIGLAMSGAVWVAYLVGVLMFPPRGGRRGWTLAFVAALVSGLVTAAILLRLASMTSPDGTGDEPFFVMMVVPWVVTWGLRRWMTLGHPIAMGAA